MYPPLTSAQRHVELNMLRETKTAMHMQMAEMGRKIASDMTAANGAQASVEAQVAAAADKAKLEHRLAQLSAEVTAFLSCLSQIMWRSFLRLIHVTEPIIQSCTLCMHFTCNSCGVALSKLYIPSQGWL